MVAPGFILHCQEGQAFAAQPVINAAEILETSLYSAATEVHSYPSNRTQCTNMTWTAIIYIWTTME